MNAKPTRKYWFHCGRCGNLFQAVPGLRDDRFCSHCGFEPATGVLHAGEQRGGLPQAIGRQATGTNGNSNTKPTKSARTHSTRDAHGDASRKPKRKASLTVLIAGAWFGSMLLIIAAAKLLWPAAPEHRSESQVNRDQQHVVTESRDAVDGKFLNDEGPAALEIFSKFLSSSTPEERNQYVIKPLQSAIRMDRFYREHSMPILEPQDFHQKEIEVLRLADGTVGLYSIWQHKQGQLYDTLMLKEDGEWKLDWEHFVRYASEPFSMFISGNGDTEGEFLLLVRERLAEERKDLDTMSLVFYSPRAGRPQEEGQASPEINVSRRSPEGKLLHAALQRAARGETVFRLRTREQNPDRMARVRVVLQRSGADTERKFRVARVLACHWFSINDPGIHADELERNPGQ